MQKILQLNVWSKVKIRDLRRELNNIRNIRRERIQQNLYYYAA